MHEQSIVESILAVALEHAERAKASKIVRVHVVVGELSGVVDEAASFYFSFLSKDTIAAQAVLCFRHVAAEFRCRQCDRVFAAEGRGPVCPECRDPIVDIVAGRELYVDSLEVE